MSANPFNFFDNLFPAPKPATLPSAVVTAVQCYNRPEHQEIIRKWLKCKEINAVDAHGLSVLHYAAAAGINQLVNHFIKKGASVHLEDPKGMTPLIYSLINIGAKSNQEKTRIHQCLEILINAGATFVSPKSSIFPQAAMNIVAQQGDVATFKFLQSHSAPVDQDILGTPLWWAERSTLDTNDMVEYLNSLGAHATLGHS